MKKRRTNFQPDDGELFPNAMADLEAMLASIEADQVLDAIPMDTLESIDVDTYTPEQLLETMQVGFAVQQQILDAWGRDLARQAIALGLDPKALRLPY